MCYFIFRYDLMAFFYGGWEFKFFQIQHTHTTPFILILNTTVPIIWENAIQDP